jgi:uncharacterized protein YhbP (UPF0306 family)
VPEVHLKRVHELLAGHSTITLATTAEGRSWAAAVFYSSDADLNIYFVTDLKTRHGRDMHRDAHVTGAINHDVSTWGEVIGLQVEGRAVVLEGEERLRALATYLEKFPGCSTGHGTPTRRSSPSGCSGRPSGASRRPGSA